MINKRFVFSFFLMVATTTTVADDSTLYFKLGGGAPIGNPASNRPSTIEYDVGASWSSNLMCGNFDISLSVRNQLNGITGAFQDTMSNVINSATGAVASLPALIIQRLNPALYDLLQNGVLQSQREFDIAKTSCEELNKQVGQYLDTAPWTEMAKRQFYANQSEAGGVDLVTVQQEAATTGVNDGIEWIGGQAAGGAAQPPIMVVEDISKAGYNLLLNRDPTNTNSAALICNGDSLCEAFDTPQEASDWLTRVVGDTYIRVCETCDKLSSFAGLGLGPTYLDTAAENQQNLIDLVEGVSDPTDANLQEVSGGQSLLVTRDLIDAIRQEEQPEYLITRLSTEMALATTMEQALMARRMLLAGQKESNVANNQEAIDASNEALAELEQEIENLLFELNVRQKISSTTPAALLERNRHRRVPYVPQQSDRIFEEGREVD